MTGIDVFSLPADIFNYFYHYKECDRCGNVGCNVISYNKSFHEECLFMENCECCNEPGCNIIYECSHTFHDTCSSCEDCPTCNSQTIHFRKRNRCESKNINNKRRRI